MAEGEQPSPDAAGSRGGRNGLLQRERRLAQGAGDHLAVVPGQSTVVDQDLGHRLLGRPSSGERGGAQVRPTALLDLALCEDACDEPRRARDDGGESLGVDDVDTDADNGCGEVALEGRTRPDAAQRYSTVTDLARFRG